MKITDNKVKIPPMTAYDDIEEGECFLWEGNYYIKSNDGCAVRFEDGVINDLDCSDVVQLVVAEVIIHSIEGS